MPGAAVPRQPAKQLEGVKATASADGAERRRSAGLGAGAGAGQPVGVVVRAVPDRAARARRSTPGSRVPPGVLGVPVQSDQAGGAEPAGRAGRALPSNVFDDGSVAERRCSAPDVAARQLRGRRATAPCGSSANPTAVRARSTRCGPRWRSTGAECDGRSPGHWWTRRTVPGGCVSCCSATAELDQQTFTRLEPTRATPDRATRPRCSSCSASAKPTARTSCCSCRADALRLPRRAGRLPRRRRRGRRRRPGRHRAARGRGGDRACCPPASGRSRCCPSCSCRCPDSW